MWQRFLLSFSIVALVAICGPYLFVLAVDPLGVSPLRVVSPEHYVRTNRRFIVPQIIRGGRYDSFLVGTSTINPIDPAWAERAFGGRFANVAIHGGTPYELSRVVRLIAAQGATTKRVILGFDIGWCSPGPLSRYHPEATFPDWLYDDDRLQHLAHLLNWKTVQLSERKVKVAMGRARPAFPPNGFKNELPPETRYDLAKARATIHAAGTVTTIAAAGKTAAGPADTGDWPALELLRQALAALPADVAVIGAMMPSHVAVQPVNGSPAATRLEDCKQRISGIVGPRGGPLVDFMLPSPWTRDDASYWDGVHFRTSVAAVFMARLVEALGRSRAADDGVYRLVGSGDERTLRR